MTKKPLLTKKDIINNFDGQTYTRGYSYYKQKKVQKFKVYEESEDTVAVIRSEVKGSRPYGQKIDIDVRGKERLRIFGYCTCPVGYNCKHVVAALFRALAETVPNNVQNSADKWLEHFMKVHQKTPHVKHERNEEAFLIVRLFRKENNDFEFCKAKILKNGSLSKGTSILIDNMIFYANMSYQYPYLTEEDRVLIGQMANLSIGRYEDEYRFRDEYGAFMLKKLAETGKCYMRDSSIPLKYVNEPKVLSFEWINNNDTYSLVSTLSKDEELMPNTTPAMCINIKENTLYEIQGNYTKEELACFFNAPEMSSKMMRKVTQKVVETLPDVSFPLPKSFEIEELKTKPIPHLYLYANATGVHMMELHFMYDVYEINVYPFKESEMFSSNDALVKVYRDNGLEQLSRNTIEILGFDYEPTSQTYMSYAKPNMQIAIERWRDFLENHIGYLRDKGWQIEIDDNFNFSFEYADAVVVDSNEESDANPWFELSFFVEVGGRSVALMPIVSSLLEEYDSIEEIPEKLNLQMDEGKFLHIKSKDIKPILQTIFELFDKKEGDNLIIQPYDAHLIDLDTESTIIWKGAKELKALAQKLKDFQGIESITPAKTLNATLRDYQQFGLDWLHFLYTFRFSGILADDMGLGKTVQTLAFLQYLKSKNKLDGPTLVIMPTSLIGNWKNEIAKFTPGLTVLELYGLDRADKFTEIHQHDIILTTYALVQRDVEKYEKEKFFYIILDEAQKIKNPKTKMALAIKSLHTQHRLALSGTPIENHLGELWSIFDFLMPGFLDNLKFFKSLYQNPIEKEHNVGRRELLNKKVAPFILRRTKEAVALELPSKTEIIKRAKFDKKQAALYENIRVTMEKKVREAIKGKGLSRSHITILDALLKLRQVCCDPSLLSLEAAKEVKVSSKLELFLELMEELQAEGRKVLVFSQFTSMLSILEKEIKKRKYTYSKLTGATRKREEAIEAFTKGNANIFLISLKAGGVGLNLVEADTVIHYDPWWNPAVENQATDRAYRIGQDKPVFVYKLIVENSIEEQILKLQEKKRTLQDSIYKGNADKEDTFKGEELVGLLKK